MTDTKRTDVAHAVEQALDNTAELATTWARTGLTVASEALQSAARSLELAHQSLNKLRDQLSAEHPPGEGQEPATEATEES